MSNTVSASNKANTSLRKTAAVLAVTLFSGLMMGSVQADVKYGKVAKSDKKPHVEGYRPNRRSSDRNSNRRQADRNRSNRNQSNRNSNRQSDDKHRRSKPYYSRRYDRRYNDYGRYSSGHYNRGHYNRGYSNRRYSALTNCRYVYDSYGYRVKRCYPKRYRASYHDNGYYHGHRFHDRYGAYYSSYHNGRYRRSHHGHSRSGYYYDSRVGEWILLAVLFDRLLDH